jgi:hypothetical protein
MKGLEQQVQGEQGCEGFQKSLWRMIFWEKSVGRGRRVE